ncbi:DnaJ C-terminal domain-containing protein [Halodesulfovibrio marinisediminis]|uniref:Curved DNA-binding protein n=1 Tax=Halodesulfovibrio marinisediminis DSM 17456 TaxID=1121457 RepID=A0A1N6DT98_9BACT|nr:J domain-containing protein [Halodesulfovibrio marinisediminis]SIN74022.1 curved DNA-binding protein [Halodesulfovibrio marinisediminis DSM 17456]
MAVEYKDYYKILGVSKTAGKDEISRAFKKLARKYHPDLNSNNPEAEKKFKEANEAYEVLKDPEKRRMYDQLGPNWQQGQHFGGAGGFQGQQFGGFQGGGDFSDFFETIFGGGGFQGAGGFQGFGGQGGYANRPQRGRDVEASLSLTLEEAYHGGRKSITLSEAGGGTKALEVNIPAGIKDGARIRLSGQGDQGYAGGPAGDLYLKVTIAPHHRFTLDGLNIILDLPLSPWEAALGTEVTVPTLDGNVSLRIAPGTGSGRKLRLRGKGLGGTSNKGDQFVRIKIVVPESATDKQKELWDELAKECGSFSPRDF